MPGKEVHCFIFTFLYLDESSADVGFSLMMEWKQSLYAFYNIITITIKGSQSTEQVLILFVSKIRYFTKCEILH